MDPFSRLRDELEPARLLALVQALAPEPARGRSGVPVGRIAGELLSPLGLEGPERARVYLALRAALERAVEGMDELTYVTGLS